LQHKVKDDRDVGRERNQAFARLEMSYGSWLRRQRRITESRPHLRAARDMFDALGVPPWADKASAELRASGERMAEPPRAPRQSLSPQELQIAQMASSGLSNREIGDRLFLSHRTVAAHLYRVFRNSGSFPGQSWPGLWRRSSRL
jgi:ATP/maltotriose-dependent transcriptional regulator MalT